jgi:glyoxylase-like metal-dependent hydrolase (beta-lactamase superfamily II)
MHRLSAVVVVVVVVVVSGCAARATPARQVLDDAVRAVGGRGAIESTHTLVLRGEGEYFVIGEGPNLEHDSLMYKITDLSRAIDFARSRWRQSQVLTPMWAAQSREPTREITALDGEIAFDVEPDGTATRAADTVARGRRAELRHSPIGILQAALAPGAVVANSRREGANDIIDIRTPAGEVFTLTIDGTTRLPLRVSSLTDDPVFGDVIVASEFTGYQRAGTLTLPTQITSKLERQPTTRMRVSYEVNGAVGELAAPAQAQVAASPTPPTVTTEVLAPGVWLLAGGSHHSVVVELADHLLLIEAPLDDARALAVIAAARALRPDKPLTHAVCTHHHVDHSGGVRAAVSEGLTIIAHERNKPFLEQLVARPHTIAPDALARKPQRLRIETVGARMTIDDPVHPVELLAADSPHADTMLVAYLPRERLLIETDLYTPAPPGAPALAHPHAIHLLRVVESQHLDVERVVSLHRQIATLADLVAAAHQSVPD